MENPTLKKRAARLGMSFVFNGRPVYMEAESDATVLEMLGGHGHHGTKEGCGEGDCGACTVAIGELVDGKVRYRAVTSCLMPASQLQGRHLVTIEGLGDRTSLHPIQQAIVNSHGTQCGFCTPGFIMSLFVLFSNNPQPEDREIREFLTGNLCRCTGYDSIVHGARMALDAGAAGELPQTFGDVAALLKRLNAEEPFPKVVRYCEQALPGSLERPAFRIAVTLDEVFQHLEEAGDRARIIAGGSDLLVAMKKAGAKYTDLLDITRVPELNSLHMGATEIRIGAALSIAGLEENQPLMEALPALAQAFSLMASPQVKAMASLGGNLGNASPIADTVPPLWAMGAQLELVSRKGLRRIGLDSFFLDYKSTALQAGEIISAVILPNQPEGTLASFEKVSKRRHLDIATANSSLVMTLDSSGKVASLRHVVGGCGPVAIETVKSSGMLVGQTLTADLVLKAALQASGEVRPMDDVRGSADYRRALVEGMMLKHFARLFPEMMSQLPVFSLDPEV